MPTTQLRSPENQAFFEPGGVEVQSSAMEEDGRLQVPPVPEAISVVSSTGAAVLSPGPRNGLRGQRVTHGPGDEIGIKGRE